MSSILERPTKRATSQRLALQSLHREVLELSHRVSDLKDLRELNQAIERNGAKPLIPWAKAKKEPGLA